MTSPPEPDSGDPSITARLGGDHDEIDRMLAGVLAAVRLGGWSEAGDKFAELLAHLRQHLAIEEDILFPLFDDRFRTVGPTRILRREHRILIGRLDRIASAIRGRSASAFDASFRAVDELLPHHMAKEENILYASIDRILSDDEQLSLAERIDQQLGTQPRI